MHIELQTVDFILRCICDSRTVTAAGSWLVLAAAAPVTEDESESVTHSDSGPQYRLYQYSTYRYSQTVVSTSIYQLCNSLTWRGSGPGDAPSCRTLLRTQARCSARWARVWSSCRCQGVQLSRCVGIKVSRFVRCPNFKVCEYKAVKMSSCIRY